jgi:AcrR family transcriptional regulator
MATSPITASLERLPSGRHRLTREVVEASQRGRLILAVAEAVADKGYDATTVADIVERAGVSRSTFYEQFAEKEACFLAAYDTGAAIILGRLRSEADSLPRSDWRGRVRSGIETFFQALTEEPAFAWSLHVEVLKAGPAALDRRAEVFDVFSERTRRLYGIARQQNRVLPRLPKETFLMHTGGMDELVRDCLRTSGTQSLTKLVEPIARTTLALFGERENDKKSGGKR